MVDIDFQDKHLTDTTPDGSMQFLNRLSGAFEKINKCFKSEVVNLKEYAPNYSSVMKTLNLQMARLYLKVMKLVRPGKPF